MTTEDLRQYRVRVDKALHGTYRGRYVYTNHPPGAGPRKSVVCPCSSAGPKTFARRVLLQMLHVLENYDLTERTPLNIHRVVETLKFAFASRYVRFPAVISIFEHILGRECPTQRPTTIPGVFST
jgi:gamma-glutamyltranspeptidase/glutathione hydrolase/leukotriene-C4 hydrolase